MKGVIKIASKKTMVDRHVKVPKKALIRWQSLQKQHEINSLSDFVTLACNYYADVLDHKFTNEDLIIQSLNRNNKTDVEVVDTLHEVVDALQELIHSDNNLFHLLSGVKMDDQALLEEGDDSE